jgi:hypothetical protein
MQRLLFALAATAASALAQPSLLRLPAAADASASQDVPATNFGSAAIVTSGKDFTSTPTFRVWFTRGHYQFDLSPLAGLPAPARARLRVWQAQSFAAGCLEATLHRLTAPWSEATVTWNNKPAHDPAVIATACVGDSFDLGWKVFDVTALVQGWRNGTFPNHGLVIRDPTEHPAGAARPLHAASREAADPAQHPQLEVAWDTVPFGAGCAPGTIPSLDLFSGSPALGDTYVLRAETYPSGTAVAFFVGVSDTTWNGVPLPINLAFLGFASCNLLVSGELVLSRAADSRGRAQLAVSVPLDNSLINARLFHQAASIDQTPALLLTNGFAVRFF